jgi:hypothetical protein
MMDLKTFAIPFGVLMMALWVYLFWTYPKTLLTAFLLTGIVVVVFYRNAEITEMVVEPRRVLVRMSEIREEVFAKAEEVRRLAEAMGELTAYNIANLWRFAPEDPEAARLAEKDRIAAMLRDAGVAEDRIRQLVSKVGEMVLRDLAHNVWHEVPKSIFSTGAWKGIEQKDKRDPFVDRLLKSEPGRATEIAREYFQPVAGWVPEVEYQVKRFDEFRRTGRLLPKPDKTGTGAFR